jgi:hypothetical protein
MSQKQTYESSKLLSIEDVKLDTKYTFTVSPCDDHQYFNEDDREEKFRKLFKMYFKKWININVFLYPELSPRGRLHFHGTIMFKTEKSIKKFFLFYVSDILRKSQIEIDTIGDADTWRIYCSKQAKYFGWVLDNTKDDSLSSIAKQEVAATFKPFSSFLNQ